MAETRTPAQRAQIEQARKLAAAWHSTPEGRENARRAATISWEKRPDDYATCGHCGKDFMTPYPGRAKYCSPNCSRTAREQANNFAVRVNCPVCNIEFWQNKWKHTPTTCSRICGQRLRRQSRER